MKSSTIGTSKMFAVLAMVASLITATLVQAQARSSSEQIKAFFAAQGCAIGPTTIAAAAADGIDPAAIEAYAAVARANPHTVKTGDWLVLSPEVCEIRPPNVTSEIRLSDPEVIQNLSAIDAYAKDGDIGCFLAGPGLSDTVKVSRNWSNDKANLEYLRFLSASIISGELSFYSPSPLRTPPGFIVTSGKCADIPQIADIKHSHDLLMRHFGALIRADAAGEAICESNGGVPSWKFDEVAEQIMDSKAPNAWLGFEIKIIAMGAEWYDGMTATDKGIPRPPLCRYSSRMSAGTIPNASNP